MTNRKLIAFGVPPLFAYPLVLLLFVGFSVYLFSKTEFAIYLYLLIALSFLTKLTHKERNEFLKICFTKLNYRKIRMAENLSVVLPFLVFLMYQKQIIFIPILILFSVAFVFVNFNTSLNFTIPTPFSKKPFEFTTGFRNTFFMYPFAYFLTYMSIAVGNFNLGVFSILLVFFISMSFYFKLEEDYFIWIHNSSAKDFLIEKIKTGLLYTTFSCVPIFILLTFYYNSELQTLLLFLVLGYAYLITIILAKYSVYPFEMNVPQAVIIALTLLFPPLIIIIIPYFYKQSCKRLNTLLQ